MTDDTYHMLQVTLICVLLIVLGFKTIKSYPELFAVTNIEREAKPK